jgi:hypothetical protein
VGVLSFQASFSPASVPGNFGNTIVTPNACRTASYKAGSGEVAVMSMSAMGSPSVNVNDVLYLYAMVSENFLQFHEKNTVDMAESLSDGTAQTSIDLRMPLEAGKSYVFGAGFASNNAVTINPGYCTGTVTIVRAG